MFLSYMHQTHYMINVYHIIILSYSFPTHYFRILYLFYPTYQMDLLTISLISLI